ncbi:helix-turn-helix domain-containing protein [Candidatus Agathobaculum pullicola]|uniref:helix-turn-helix domain-containing protein n=1 Tax=Candidatus Agathobaculum pullicola TaxID=2838426 RepID=UPI003F8DEC9D
MTVKEASEKWGVTPRRVNYYCAGGRIPRWLQSVCSRKTQKSLWMFIPKTSGK